MKRINQLLKILILLTLIGCQNSSSVDNESENSIKEKTETQNAPIEEIVSEQVKEEKSEFEKEIEKLENSTEYENSLKGKWVLQKLTIKQSGREVQEISGGLANQSFVNLENENKLNGKLTLFGSEAISGKGFWYFDSKRDIISLHIGNITDGRGKKRDDRILIVSKIGEIKNNYASFEILSIKFNGEEGFPNEQIDAIAKKE